MQDDHDPHSSRPPDSRPRPRSHKSKNAVKRRPQRGLGVAQLEKLRLEEQSKQQDAFSFTSLQLHNHGYLQFHHQEHEFPQQLRLDHHQRLQQEQQFQLPQQVPSLSLCSQVNPSEPPLGFSDSRFPGLSSIGNVQNNYLPYAAIANAGQASPLPLVISPLQLGNASERFSKLSPGEGKGTTPLGRAGKLVSRAPSTVAFGEMLWHDDHVGQVPIKEEGFTSPAACLDNSETETQCRDQDPHSTSENANAASKYLHGGHESLHLSMGKLHKRNAGGMAPLTDAYLHRPRFVGGGADWHTPQRPRHDLPVVGNDVLTGELSSFQSMLLSPPWLSANKVSNRKRSWECTREPVSTAEASKGLDLNAVADDIGLGTLGPNSNILVPLSIRDNTDISPPGSMVHRKSEDIKKAWLREKACGDTCSPDAIHPDTCTSSATFLSLRKINVEFEASDEFLKLGPSSSSIQLLESMCVVARDCNGSTPLPKSSVIATTSGPQQMLGEGERFSMALTLAENDESMSPLDDHQTSYLCTSLQRKVELTDEFSGNKEVALFQRGGEVGALDLELRLSL